MLKPQVTAPTPSEMATLLADRCRRLRLFNGLSRKTLSQMSQVPEGTLKRFEQSGKISFDALLRLAFSLDALAPFGDLFALPPARNMAELEERSTRHIPKRGRR